MRNKFTNELHDSALLGANGNSTSLPRQASSCGNERKTIGRERVLNFTLEPSLIVIKSLFAFYTSFNIILLGQNLKCIINILIRTVAGFPFISACLSHCRRFSINCVVITALYGSVIIPGSSFSVKHERARQSVSWRFLVKTYFRATFPCAKFPRLQFPTIEFFSLIQNYCLVYCNSYLIHFIRCNLYYKQRIRARVHGIFNILKYER